jgi:hypothetical protein
MVENKIAVAGLWVIIFIVCLITVIKIKIECLKYKKSSFFRPDFQKSKSSKQKFRPASHPVYDDEPVFVIGKSSKIERFTDEEKDE